MMRKQIEKSLMILSLVGSASIPAMAQKQTPPAGGPPKAFTVPAHETYKLANGMQVTLIPYGNVPKVTVNLALRTGNVNEPKEKLGVADITSELLKEGTTSMRDRKSTRLNSSH